MKINSISSQNYQIKKYQNSPLRTNSVSNAIPMRGFTRISFGKANANTDQAIFVGAESNPWTKGGGVGVVMKDYRSFGPPENQIEIIPYYKAIQDENDNVLPVTVKVGDKEEYVMKDKDDNDIKVKLVASKKMQWAKIRDNDIKLFKRIQDEGENSTDTYFVFVDDVAIMKKPYEGGMQYRSGAQQVNKDWYGDPYAKYSKAVVELLPDIIKDANEVRKAKNLPEFNPATIVCSDSQTGYVHEYLAQHAVKDKDNKKSCYYGIHPTYVGHNLGPGYCGETTARNMFVNLGATPEQIETIEKDPMFQDVKDTYKEKDYFRPFIANVLDDSDSPSAIMVPIHYSKASTANGEGFSKAFTVVSEDYAESMATNPQATQSIYSHIAQLKEDKVFDGILNPLNDPALDPSKELPNETFNKEYTEIIDGKKVHFDKFKQYPENPTYEEMREVKNYNKRVLLERFFSEDTTLVTGNPKQKADINPEAPNSKNYNVIKPELIQMIKDGRGDEVPVFVSWGRPDMQKGHDVVVRAFEKFAKTEAGKNAILILGASSIENDKESSALTKLFKRIFKDKAETKAEEVKAEEGNTAEAKTEDAKTEEDKKSEIDLQGRIVHIDGWAPAYALSSAADFAIFGSRFEPCGLTDLEAMKYYCTPIVANTQGLKQKNFDPRIESEKDKATSYKTQHEFNLLKSQVQPIIDAYVNGKESEKEKVKKEFPVFNTTDGEYDETLFKKFAEEYKKDTKKIKEKDTNGNTQGTAEVTPQGTAEETPQAAAEETPQAAAEETPQTAAEETPQAAAEETPQVSAKDWDNLSKEYNFKYYGCARTLKDGILEAELADAINAAVTADKETKEKIFQNIKNTDTSWDGNGKLHPDGKSSLQRYKELHMNKKYSIPTESDLLKITDDNKITNTIIQKQKDDLQNRRIEQYLEGSLIGGALAALISRIKGAHGVDTLKNELKSAEQKIQVNTEELDKLKSQLADATKKAADATKKAADAAKKSTRNMVIVGAAAAVAGGAITYFAAKYVNKKKAEKQPQVKPQPAQPQVTQPQTVQTQTKVEEPKPVITTEKPASTNFFQNFVSMDDFANGLNKA